MSSLRGKTILYIDDDATSRLLVKRLLEAEQVIYLEAPSGEAGLKLADEQRPHLILLDLRMPGMDGYQFLAQRRNFPFLNETPIVVLSGENDVNSVSRAIAMGAKDYVIKPFLASLMLQKIKKALRSEGFKRMVFPSEHRPKVKIVLPVTVLSANETGFMVKVPVRLGSQADIKLTAKIIDEMGCSQFIQKTGTTGRYIEEGQFASEIHLIGVSGADAKRLREAVKKFEK